MARDVLIVGPARSGTSWLARVLASAADVSLVYEPDNVVHTPYAFRATGHLGHMPQLRPGDEAPAYARLWAAVFDGGERRRRRGGVARRLVRNHHGAALAAFEGRADPVAATRFRAASLLAVPYHRRARRVIAKSVHATFALPWLTSRVDVDVIVVLKSPLNHAASLLSRGWDPPLDRLLRGPHARPVDGSVLAELLGDELLATRPSPQAPFALRMGWQIGAYQHALHTQLDDNPGWTLAQHEATTAAPRRRLSALFDLLDLEWTERTDAYLAGHDGVSTDLYDTTRRASAEADKWRRLLDDRTVGLLRDGLAPFEPALGPVDGPRTGA